MRAPQRSILMRNHRRWTPSDLGASLLALWDAERSDLITQASSLISSWKDVVAGYDAVQAVGASKFARGATSFNGRPGATMDGIDDEMLYASTTGLPAGATPFEAWAVFDQNVAPADATANVIIGWGGAAPGVRFILYRSVVGGVNRATAAVGNGTTAVIATNTSVDFSGRHVVRAIVSGTTLQVDVDGVAGAPVAVVPALGTTRLRIGSIPSDTGSSYGQGVANALPITAPLTTDQAAQMLAWGNARRGA